MNYNILNKFFFIMSGFAFVFTSCKKLDTEYRKYLEDKEIVYPGVPSNISANPGNKRVEFMWLPSPDPTVSKYVIYWNDHSDSAVFNVPDGKQAEFTKGVINNLKEGTYFFVIYTYDHKNNRSIPVAINNVRVFGDFYQTGLVNRTVTSTSLDQNGTVGATFAVPENETNISTEIKYTSLSGIDTSIYLAPKTNSISISDWKEGTPVVYRSAYKPVINAIDTFYTQRYDTLVIKKEVTNLYLKNTTQPFQSVQTSNRFRDPKDWIVNQPVKNHNNMGGWGSDNNTVLCMESGWGSPDIINGKMYQNVMLPAGTYSFQIELGPNGYTGLVRMVAIEGTMLPDFTGSQVPGALAVADLAVKNITFTISQPTMVTLGFLVRMQGNQFWRITKVKLLQHL